MINPKEAVFLLSFDATNKKRRRRAAAGAAGLFLVGALFGAYLFTEFPLDLSFSGDQTAKEAPEETPPDALDVTVPREDVVAPDAKVEWIARFSKCEHEVALDPAGEVAGKTRAEILRAYPEYTLALFGKEAVRLVRNVEGYCPAHYTLTLGEEALVITRMDLAALSEQEVMRVIVDPNALDEESRAALEAGVTFDSLEDINLYLEGAE